MSEWRVNNCPKCGGPLKSMSEDIKFCPYCGTELEKVIDTKKSIYNININKSVRNSSIIRDEARLEETKTEAKKKKWDSIETLALLGFVIFCYIIMLIIYFRL